MDSAILSTGRDSEQSETFGYNKREATRIYGARATCRREDQREYMVLRLHDEEILYIFVVDIFLAPPRSSTSITLTSLCS